MPVDQASVVHGQAGSLMSQFGKLLRIKRRNSQDSERGGPLTQIRLGEFIGDYLSDLGYSGAAISHWENGWASPSRNEREEFSCVAE
jgi:hypothetical protein